MAKASKIKRKIKNSIVNSSNQQKNSFKREVAYYLWCFGATFLFATKMTLIRITHFPQIWVFFIQNAAILIISILMIAGYIFTAQRKNKSFRDFIFSELTIFKHRSVLLSSLLSGFTNAMGGILIIFAIRLSRESGSDSVALNWILNVNIIIALIAGLFMFSEKHSLTQYFGGALIMLSSVFVSCERRFEAKGVHTEEQNVKFYMSILLTFITTLLISIKIVLAKYASFWYKPNMTEYSALTMLVTGAIGWLSVIPILYWQVPIAPAEAPFPWGNIVIASASGAITIVAQLLHFIAFSLGSVEVVMLFSSLKSIVQITEESLFLFIVPSFHSWIIMLIAIFGSMLVIRGSQANKEQTLTGNKKIS